MSSSSSRPIVYLLVYSTAPVSSAPVYPSQPIDVFCSVPTTEVGNPHDPSKCRVNGQAQGRCTIAVDFATSTFTEAASCADSWKLSYGIISEHAMMNDKVHSSSGYGYHFCCTQHFPYRGVKGDESNPMIA